MSPLIQSITQSKNPNYNLQSSSSNQDSRKGEDFELTNLFHGGLSGGHELSSETELAMGAENGEGSDVAVALVALLFHLGEDVADDAAVVVLGDVEKLRPREDVVEVVLHLVVLGKAHEVAGLHREQIVHRRSPDAHHGCCCGLDSIH